MKQYEMNLYSKLTSNKIIIIASFISGIFIIYPNIIELPWELTSGPGKDDQTGYLCFFSFRYVFFCLLTWILLIINIKKITTPGFLKRLIKTLAITLGAYAVYLLISFLLEKHIDCFTGMLLFQFIVICSLCTLTGHTLSLYVEQKRKEQEIEQLKLESLQSRCDALTNQIHPHFFFNSLNGLSFLVRENNKEHTLEYIQKLSEVFRYILQSDKKNLVPLSEELNFLESYRYLLEVRYANKLSFNIEISNNRKTLQIPVLSLLPLIENVVKHNVIDSENPMEISVILNDNELLVSNPVRTKLEECYSNKIGLANLKNRFQLLMNMHLKVEIDNNIFRVYLPLKNEYQ